MNIQSISIVVPTKKCVNKCPFCVSRMHGSPYVNEKYDEFGYKKRLKYAVMNNVNTLILTGTGEPLQNWDFLQRFKETLKDMNDPFPNIELQTTGVFLLDHVILTEGDDKTYKKYHKLDFLKQLGVNTISLSVSNIFNNFNNQTIIGIPKKLQFDLTELCKVIKDHGFNLRLSLNMSSVYDKVNPWEIINQCKVLGANQITIRELYSGNGKTKEDLWVEQHRMDGKKFSELNRYIQDNGNQLYQLPFGAIVYSIQGMSTAIDDDCMSTEVDQTLKYVIVRENGKLYCRWNDEGSLIF